MNRPVPRWLKRATWVMAIIMVGPVLFMGAVQDIHMSYGFWVGLLWGWLIAMPGRELRTKILDDWGKSNQRWAEALEQAQSFSWPRIHWL